MPTGFDLGVVHEEKGKGKKSVLRFHFKGFKTSDTASAVVVVVEKNKTLTVTATKVDKDGKEDERKAEIKDVDIQVNPDVTKHLDYIEVVVIKDSDFDMNKKISQKSTV